MGTHFFTVCEVVVGWVAAVLTLDDSQHLGLLQCHLDEQHLLVVFPEEPLHFLHDVFQVFDVSSQLCVGVASELFLVVNPLTVEAVVATNLDALQHLFLVPDILFEIANTMLHNLFLRIHLVGKVERTDRINRIVHR